MTEKPKPLSLRVEADLHARLQMLVDNNKIGTLSSFAHEAIRLGLPALESRYLGTHPTTEETAQPKATTPQHHKKAA